LGPPQFAKDAMARRKPLTPPISANHLYIKLLFDLQFRLRAVQNPRTIKISYAHLQGGILLSKLHQLSYIQQPNENRKLLIYIEPSALHFFYAF
jgi:hypothetical protein